MHGRAQGRGMRWHGATDRHRQQLEHRDSKVSGDEVTTFEVESLERLRRVIADGDQASWAAFQRCLEETALAWLHEHPSREAACRWRHELCINPS
jgi:hypothetical protein